MVIEIAKDDLLPQPRRSDAAVPIDPAIRRLRWGSLKSRSYDHAGDRRIQKERTTSDAVSVGAYSLDRRDHSLPPTTRYYEGYEAPAATYRGGYARPQYGYPSSSRDYPQRELYEEKYGPARGDAYGPPPRDEYRREGRYETDYRDYRREYRPHEEFEHREPMYRPGEREYTRPPEEKLTNGAYGAAKTGPPAQMVPGRRPEYGRQESEVMSRPEYGRQESEAPWSGPSLDAQYGQQPLAQPMAQTMAQSMAQQPTGPPQYMQEQAGAMPEER